ncbi:hypothetical protein MPH_06985 [Macrophomina phaseolina MS6]|uniref:Secreted protein n=1 Tax=Macrophomina phaseolina (strain MS6) TaxID=1126212 RepID=K2RSS3_MACPH|nr:hypothetical protein MPH_06985 [Macrophomina phaseolina MS6]
MRLNHALWILLNPVLCWACHGLPRLLLGASRFSIFSSIFSYSIHSPPIVRFTSGLTRCLSAPGLNGSCLPRSLLSLHVRCTVHWPSRCPSLSLSSSHLPRCRIRSPPNPRRSPMTTSPQGYHASQIHPCAHLLTSHALPAPAKEAPPREDQGAAETTQVIVNAREDLERSQCSDLLATRRRSRGWLPDSARSARMGPGSLRLCWHNGHGRWVDRSSMAIADRRWQRRRSHGR